LEDRGFYWLSDYNSGNLLVGKQEGEPYIPYRIQFPSGEILDEEEIFQDFSILEKKGFSRKNIQLARNLYYSINHEDVNKDKYKFNNLSFVSKKDYEKTIERYLKDPFYLESA
jgi:hypothetical protein